MPPGPRSVGCERVTDPWGQPDPVKPHCGFWCATGPAPMAHRGLGVLWGCGGAQLVAMWWATRWVTGVRPSPRWGRFVTPVTADGGCEPLQRPGVVPRCHTHPGGVLGVLWGACMAALALKSPSGRFSARLIAKATFVSQCARRPEARNITREHQPELTPRETTARRAARGHVATDARRTGSRRASRRRGSGGRT